MWGEREMLAQLALTDDVLTGAPPVPGPRSPAQSGRPAAAAELSPRSSQGRAGPGKPS